MGRDCTWKQGVAENGGCEARNSEQTANWGTNQGIKGREGQWDEGNRGELGEQSRRKHGPRGTEGPRRGERS